MNITIQFYILLFFYINNNKKYICGILYKDLLFFFFNFIIESVKEVLVSLKTKICV